MAGAHPYRTAVRVELRRLFRAPYDDLLVLLVNAAMVCFGWLLLPPAVKEWLFTFTGPMAFAVVLETWLLADTPATNMLANDLPATEAELPSPGRMHVLLRAKAIALAVLVGPPCAVVALVIAGLEQELVVGILLAGLLLVVPFGVLAVAPWIGVRWPYHPRPLTWRWEHRKPYGRSARWLTLLVVPYGVVPVIELGLVGPALLIALVVAGRHESGRLTTAAVATTVGIATAITVLGFVLAPRVTTRLIRRRGSDLTDYLADPDRG